MHGPVSNQVTWARDVTTIGHVTNTWTIVVFALLAGCGGKTESAPDAATSGSDSGETQSQPDGSTPPEPDASTAPVDAGGVPDAPPASVYCSRTMGIVSSCSAGGTVELCNEPYECLFAQNPAGGPGSDGGPAQFWVCCDPDSGTTFPGEVCDIGTQCF